MGQIHVSWVDSNKERILRIIGSKARAVFTDLDELEPVRLFEKGIGKGSQDQVNYGEFKFLLRDGDIISPKIELHEPLKMIVNSFLVHYGCIKRFCKAFMKIKKFGCVSQYTFGIAKHLFIRYDLNRFIVI